MSSQENVFGPDKEFYDVITPESLHLALHKIVTAHVSILESLAKVLQVKIPQDTATGETFDRSSIRKDYMEALDFPAETDSLSQDHLIEIEHRLTVELKLIQKIAHEVEEGDLTALLDSNPKTTKFVNDVYFGIKRLEGFEAVDELDSHIDYTYRAMDIITKGLGHAKAIDELTEARILKWFGPVGTALERGGQVAKLYAAYQDDDKEGFASTFIELGLYAAAGGVGAAFTAVGAPAVAAAIIAWGAAEVVKYAYTNYGGKSFVDDFIIDFSDLNARRYDFTENQIALRNVLAHSFGEDHASEIVRDIGLEIATGTLTPLGTPDDSTDGDDIIGLGNSYTEIFDRGGSDHYGGGNGMDTLSFASRDVGIQVRDGRVRRETTQEVDQFSKFEVLIATDHDDTIDATSDPNLFWIEGGAGRDIITGNGLANVLIGGADNGLINSSEGDFLSGKEGDDNFISGVGSDTINGGLDFDTLDLLRASTGLSSMVINGRLMKGEGETFSVEAESIEKLIATEHNDNISLSGVGRTNAGPFEINAADGDDAIISDKSGLILDGGAGTDTLDYSNLTTGLRFTLETKSDYNDTPYLKTDIVDRDGLATLWAATAKSVEGFRGGSGNDLFQLNTQNATARLDGGDGVDTLRLWNLSNEQEFGVKIDSGHASLIGDTGDEKVLDLELSNIEIVEGTLRDDEIHASDEMTMISGREGNDRLHSSIHLLQVDGGNGHNTLDLSKMNNGIWWEGNYSAILGDNTSMRDWIAGAKGEAIYNAHKIDILHATKYDDYIKMSYGNFADGGAGNDEIIGDSSNEVIFGGADNDVLKGNGGDDILDAGTGDDILFAGSGDDKLYGGQGGDTFCFAGRHSGHNTIFDFDPYQDKVDFGLAEHGGHIGSTSVLGDAVRVSIVHTGRECASVTFKGVTRDDLLEAGIIGDTPQMTGTIYNDYLYGTAENDKIYGLAGNDVIYGRAGNDWLDGGAGNDRLEGGGDNDSYYWTRGMGVDSYFDESGFDKLVLNYRYAREATMGQYFNTVQNGIDFVDLSGDRSYRTYDARLLATAENDTWDISTLRADKNIRLDVGMGAGHDKITVSAAIDQAFGGDGEDTLIGSDQSDRLYGNNDNDTITANGGNDWLDGGAGSDRLEGGLGNDTYYWTRGSEIDSYYDIGGIDTLKLNVNYAKEVTLGQTFNTVENGLDRVDLSGDRSYRTYDAKLNGTDGDDIWDVSTLGADKNIKLDISMGAGNDTVKVSAAVDQAFGGAGNDTLIGSDGSDRLYGGGDNDTIKAEGGNDWLDGGTGDDRLEGGLDNDTYYWTRGSGIDSYFDTGGHDTLKIHYKHANETTLGKVFNTVQNGLDHIDLLGDRSYRSYSGRLNGTSEDDIWDVSGLTTDRNLSLDIVMGAGNDSVRVSEAINRAIGGAGNDTLIGSAGSDKLLGNDDDDIIIGNAGNDWLDGGAGSDTLEGGLDNDVYYWTRGSGVDSYRDAGGHDTLKIHYSYAHETTLGRIFNTVQNGIDHVDLHGDRYYRSYNGRLNGTSENDVWDVSGLTTDRNLTLDIIMGAGDDYVKVSGAINRAIGGYGEDTLVGSDESDSLHGNHDNDTIKAGGGNDWLAGGAGSDHLEGGSGDDTYYWTRGDGVDTYLDVDGTDTLKLDYRYAREATMGSDFNTVENGIDHVNLHGHRTYRKYDATLVGTEGNDTWDVSNLTKDRNLSVDISLGGGNDRAKISVHIDQLFGGNGNDILQGSAGSDRIYGGNHDDVIYAGGGQDYINGGSGHDLLMLTDDFSFSSYDEDNDTYRFSNGEHVVTAYQIEAYGFYNDDPLIF